MENQTPENQESTNNETFVSVALNAAASSLSRLATIVTIILKYIFEEMDSLDRNLIKMNNLYGFICQLFFFSLCDMIMLRTRAKESGVKPITGPTTLLFYTVFTYFVSKVRDIVVSNFANIEQTYSRLDLLRWVFKLVLEWAKAIIIVVCLKEQGIVYKPKTLYTVITFIYYVCTEKVFLDIMPDIVRYFNFEVFDSMEHLYVPIAMYIYSIGASLTVTSYMLASRVSWYIVFSAYFTLYMRVKDLAYNYISVLYLEMETFQSFKTATPKDIQDWDDICAVCLNSMSRAKITPCNHLFHPHCLRLCLQSSFKCPLCKKDFLQ